MPSTAHVAGRILMLAALWLSIAMPAIATDKVSRPGVYQGYSPVLYDGYVLNSRYVAMRDGTRIAVDIIRPTQKGAVVTRKLPVIWMNTPYNRRTTDGGLTAELYPGAAMGLVKYGYVVVVADMRGNYASFGKAVHANRNEWSPWAYWDAYDLTEWLARQDWSDSKIGMWGCSATGHSQWQAVATRPPHLKAVFPMSAPSEYYDWGGVGPYEAPNQPYPGAVPAQDAQAVPVDGDSGGALLDAARQEHRYNIEPGLMPYRDSVAPDLAAKLGWKNYRYWLEANTLAHLADINKSGIPAYQTANYGEDLRVKLGVMVKLRSVTNPIKLVLGPDRHCTWTSDYKKSAINHFNPTIEELRWFDYWLKGVPNGIMDQPPIYYYTYNLPEAQAWHYAWQWPLPTQRNVAYYLGGGASLDRTAPAGAGGKDDYTVDYGVTPANRNARGMTYTSPALATDMPMTGHPVLHLWVSSTATDGDFLAALADIGPDGTVTSLPGTDDGQLRASHRKLSPPPYDNLGLPYHRSYAADVTPLVPGQPVELTFDLAPISWVFKAGHHIRLIVSCVGAPHKEQPPVTPVRTPAPVVTFYRDAAHRSYLDMPGSAPIAAAARVVEGASERTVTLTFPRSLDPRYVADVKSVRYDGLPARTMAAHGNTLTATFAKTATSAPARIEGSFGRSYDYGDQMTFAAIVRP